MKTTHMKKLVMSTLALVFCLAIFAQKDKRVHKAKIEEKKMAFCNEKAGLSAQEADAYWVLRKKVDEEKRIIKKNAPKLKKLDLETASEGEIKAALIKINSAHAKADQLEVEYLDEFLKVVSAKKLAKLQLAEKAFKREVLKDIRDGNMPPPPPPPAKN